MVANPLSNDGISLSKRMKIAALVPRETECEPCDPEGGVCDSNGICVCNKGRTGADCSRGKSTNPLSH